MIRLNKYLSAAGFCSRRAADRLIASGRVTVDGMTAGVGTVMEEDALVCVDGEPVSGRPEEVLLIVHKPVGIVCTAERREKDNIIDFLRYPTRIYPIGRLDKDSHGLILMTNVGALHNEITRAANGHEKEYEVTVNRAISGQFLARMAEGVYLSELDYQTRPAAVRRLGERTFSITLTEGKNRQIRRMCEELGYRVRDLMRTRVMGFTLDGIPEGGYRPANEREWDVLRGMMHG